ncbi:3-dehydro-L-gulonate 2-dehydrogenase [candidate division KSB1 bacterium]|nr:3-dehydro-L-gulonate 2-dehydrogenase [candidate division KSB1 bacterium]
MKYIAFDELKKYFYEILINHGFADGRAEACADIFAVNSLDGVYSHGVNRFPYFVKMVKLGFIDASAAPKKVAALNAIEQWDGCLGPGPLNALEITDRAMELARQYGIGCVALANTNHWMRAGYYGWHAARAGFMLIAWTNAIPNMPAWGSIKPALGNNPIVMAVPYEDRAIVLDTALSQFSYGKMRQYKINNTPLPYPGGYGEHGQLTTDAATILNLWSALPIGYWKGAGLALLLDVIAVALSGGLATHQLGTQEHEHGVSQVFIAVDISRFHPADSIDEQLQQIIHAYKQSPPIDDKTEIVYPGERTKRIRADNLKNGIPVDDKTWDRIVELSK